MFCFTLPGITHAQNYAGLREPAIKKLIVREMPGFSQQNDVINSAYKYLKYETDDGQQTLLVFLNENDVCTEVRLNFDKSLLKEKTREFDEKYRRTGDNAWEDKRRGTKFLISLKDETWYYSASIRQASK